MNLKTKLMSKLVNIVKEDRENVFYLVFYSVIEAILLLALPLASSFIINSILAHANISVSVLGFIVIVVFIVTTMLQVVKQYITEKFEQKIFVSTGIKIAKMATKVKSSSSDTKHTINKYMNYFFDIVSIQKIFPILLLDGVGLFIKLIVSLLLLLVFDTSLFMAGLFFFILFVVILLYIGRNGVEYAIERSNAKHDAIYYLQNIPELDKEEVEILKDFDGYLKNFIYARERIFNVIIKQLTLTFMIEGVIFSSFLIIGGHLVINGNLPLGEFVAAEIIVVSIIYALKSFMKQLDYIYDMFEGLYKVEKLSLTLKESSDV